ncbi:MAG: chemotaxis protein CheW [Rhodoferax sp.]|nr:chemotaxis protein CheW [Rhodoferax sp.]MCF8209672.1 chemotaxis protein CheW [Rhodoferax sp.]
MGTESSNRHGTGGDGSHALQYLTFSLGHDVFAMDIRSVREIIQFGAMTVVPLMPEFIRGVINLRGAVVPVIDLHARFSGTRSVVNKKTCIIIFDTLVEGDKVELGLMVDAVSEVIDITPDRIEPPPQFGSSIPREFISGMGKVDSAFVILIAPERALNIEEMAHLAEEIQLIA